MSRWLLRLLYAGMWSWPALLAAQSIDVDIEPRSPLISHGNTVVHYERVAPPATYGQTTGRLCLRVAITNKGVADLQLTNVAVAVGSQQFPPVSANMIIKPTKTGIWSNQGPTPNNPSDCPLFLLPAPTTGKLTLSFGTSTQTKTFTLMAHDGPGYSFPFKAADRPTGEFWFANSTVHGTGTEGSQLFAYDLTVVGIDSMTKSWSQCKTPGVDCSFANTSLKNEDFRDWGTPIYAMANGTVVHCVMDAPKNPQPWGCCLPKDSAGNQPMNPANRCTNVTTHPNSTKQTPGSGNSFYIKHGDEIVLYAHMQPADATCSNFNCGKCQLDAKGKVIPLPIAKGERLGVVGNSGNVCGAPHTHIHSMLDIKGIVNDAGIEQVPLKLRPLPFSTPYAVDVSLVDPVTYAGPWVKLNKMGPPPVWSLIADTLPVAIPPIKVVDLAIDPMALILPPKWYVMWAELKHPHEPKVGAIQELLGSMSPEERKATLDRAKTLSTYAKAVEDAFATLKK